MGYSIDEARSRAPSGSFVLRNLKPELRHARTYIFWARLILTSFPTTPDRRDSPNPFSSTAPYSKEWSAPRPEKTAPQVPSIESSPAI